MNKYLFGLLVIITTFLMGSSFAIGKIGLMHTTPLLLVSLRFLIAGVIMMIIVACLKRTHPKTIQNWLRMIIIGFFQTTGVMGCIFISLRTIHAGATSILTFMNPLLVVILGTIFFKNNYRVIQWGGVLLGFIGVFITMGGQIDLKVGTLLGFLSAVSWAFATLLIKKWGEAFDTWVLSAYQMFFGGCLLLLLSFLLETPSFSINSQSIIILLWLAIMASIVQFSLWFFLLQKGEPGKTSAFLFLAPFFGVVSGALLLDEPLHWYIIIGGILIFTGIFLVNYQVTKKQGFMKTTVKSENA
ncbi:MULTISPECIES: DMT family transporter [Bacillus]|uniref:DMT family transporter n=1 Tax=Bacillus TaxID=1386 RepID=UPI0002D623F8|nr:MULTISPECIES: DMT family transporter [Bacillus]